MRILVLGGTGMLGHKVVEVLGRRHDIWATRRGAGRLPPPDAARLESATLIDGVYAEEWASVQAAIDRAKPDAVVNCVGIVKQASEATDPVLSIRINALFPHLLVHACQQLGARLVHVSTDCVFSGHTGNYTEEDIPDPPDLYGRSKLLGETHRYGLTLRTSIIGRGLLTRFGLVDWFLSQKGGRVTGFTQAIYSGLPTITLSRLIGTLLEAPQALEGVYHVASQPINKFDLLTKLRDALGLEIVIDPSAAYRCDRSLNADRFVRASGFVVPDWHALIAELADDVRSYE